MSDAIVRSERRIVPEPICPFCGHTIQLDFSTYYSTPLVPIHCVNCHRISRMSFDWGQLREVRPRPELLTGLPGRIPEDILAIYHEAVSCLAVDAWRGACTMGRLAVQTALLTKGVPDAAPTKMIDWAESNGILPSKYSRHAAVLATFFGNKAGHPDSLVIDSDDAEQGVLVTKKLLLALFPPPAPPQIAVARLRTRT